MILWMTGPELFGDTTHGHFPVASQHWKLPHSPCWLRLGGAKIAVDWCSRYSRCSSIDNTQDCRVHILLSCSSRGILYKVSTRGKDCPKDYRAPAVLRTPHRSSSLGKVNFNMPAMSSSRSTNVPSKKHNTWKQRFPSLSCHVSRGPHPPFAERSARERSGTSLRGSSLRVLEYLTAEVLQMAHMRRKTMARRDSPSVI